MRLNWICLDHFNAGDLDKHLKRACVEHDRIVRSIEKGDAATAERLGARARRHLPPAAKGLSQRQPGVGCSARASNPLEIIAPAPRPLTNGSCIRIHRRLTRNSVVLAASMRTTRPAAVLFAHNNGRTIARQATREGTMKKHVIGGIVAGALLALASLSAQAQDAIKFGVADEPYPPFASKDASGKWVGFEMDLMDAVCAEMKAKCELVPVAWEGIIPALRAKKIDVIWASMLITEKRKQIIDFSDKYYDTPHMFIGPSR
jgi:hypothetical protein